MNKNADKVTIWEVTNDQGEIQFKALKKSDAKIFAKVFRRHLTGKFKVRSREFTAAEANAVASN